MKPLSLDLERIVDMALEEDLGHGDITTQSLLPPNIQGAGVILVKEHGIVAGVEIALAIFKRLDQQIRFDVLSTDGIWVEPGTQLCRIEGNLTAILAGERVALNFLQRLSGVATETAKFVETVSGTKARIIDTRKTTPGLRLLEKYAVRVAGGFNHRFNLSDAILIKDNHLAALRSIEGNLTTAIASAKKNAPHGMKIQLEVENFEEAKNAIEAGVDSLLLDNMHPTEMQRVVEQFGDKVFMEASGGITLENVRAVAETGVDVISIGALTHSSPALDISLDLEILN
ncbi:MAG: carboxylating nicotinate-nucleotide diphosphorylase [SAR202 cluster bacterium]|nr:carboxylating nicotinate-nucleotide diphosphorylase [SAR202 cluster bacterium]|tara:strand:+ start:4469 stop:5326 length:858 start_codon:yes stop_codon:yes gene_type:complete